MRKWEIETGGHSWTGEGTIKEAVAWAWNEQPPTAIGELVRFRELWQLRGRTRPNGAWKYIDPRVALRWAGYDLPEKRK